MFAMEARALVSVSAVSLCAVSGVWLHVLFLTVSGRPHLISLNSGGLLASPPSLPHRHAADETAGSRPDISLTTLPVNGPKYDVSDRN